MNAPAPLWVAVTHHDARCLERAGVSALCLDNATTDEVQNRIVIVTPSADRPGHEIHAERQLRAMGPATIATVSSELLHKAGARDVADLIETAQASGRTPRLDILAALTLEQARASRQRTTSERPAKLELVPIGELLAKPQEQTRWLVDGLLPAGGNSVLAARPKVGKSTLARSLGVTVARGGQFLGRDTARGSVFILDLEGKEGETVNSLRRLGATEGDPIKIFCGTVQLGALDDLRTAALRDRPVLIIVDTLQRLARVPDLNDYARVTLALGVFIDLAHDSGAHVMLLHHQGRGGRGGVDSPMGSTAIAGSVDTILTMRRREDGTRTLSSVQRYGTDLEETVVSLDACNHATAGARVRDHEQQEAGRRILAYLRDTPGAEQAAIREDVGGRWSIARAALTGLFKSGQVTRTGAGRKGDAYRYSVAGNAGFSDSAGSLEPREPENHNSVDGESI